MAIPFVMINLDKPRMLRFGMKAMVEFEQLTGIKLTSLNDDISVDVCAKLLWVMLLQDDKDMTLDKVLEIVDEYADNINDIIEKVSQAVQIAFANNNSPNSVKPRK